MRARLCAAILAVALGACARPPRAPQLEWAHDLSSGPDASVLEVLRAGGLSGIAFDPGGELLAVSDDRVAPRVLVLRVHENPLRLEPTGTISLQNAPERLDPEAIALLPGGGLLVASEGIQDEEPRIAPGIFEFTREGEFVRGLNVRRKFVPPIRGPLVAGVRGNAAFESLALTPDGRLFTAVESPLAQDGEPASFEHGARVRILEYRAVGETFVPAREFLYEIDPIARPDFPTGFAVNGLVELLALDAGELLALERSYAAEAGDGPRALHRIRLYRVSLQGATDVAGYDSLAGRDGPRPAAKTLVLDLGQEARLPAALSGLGNFEGMAFGRARPDGRRTLWLVSDNNFGWRQHTWFLQFAF